MAVSLPSLMTVIPSGLDAPPDLGMILYGVAEATGAQVMELNGKCRVR